MIIPGTFVDETIMEFDYIWMVQSLEEKQLSQEDATVWVDLLLHVASVCSVLSDEMDTFIEAPGSFWYKVLDSGVPIFEVFG